MANKEQLARLKKGVEVWNKWRTENPDDEVNLREADLRGTDLNGINLVHADLSGIDLSGAKLRRADLSGADLDGAHLNSANLSEVKLLVAKLRDADLKRANLRGARLNDADFHYANLEKTNFKKATLLGTNLSLSNVCAANLKDAVMGSTILGGIDLSKTLGLEDVFHGHASTLGTDTIQYSKGRIPKGFLRGCGLSDAEIEYAKLSNPSLSNEEINKILYNIYDLRATQALQISPLFISYSHGDGKFVDKLEKQLNERGIRFWRDIHDMKAGRIETQIDQAISQNRTVLLVLSENSLSSDWVEHEVRTARGLEKELGHDVLCPITLDDSWNSSPWPKRVMEQIMEYNILNFSGWENDVKFEGIFRKLIDGLEVFYKDKSHSE